MREKSANRTLSCTVRPAAHAAAVGSRPVRSGPPARPAARPCRRCPARRSFRWRSTWPPARAPRAGRRCRGPSSRGARRCCRSGPAACPGATGGAGRSCGCPAAGRPCCSACRRPRAARPAAGSRNSCTLSGSTTTRASGFFRSLAILARNLLGATPTEATNRNSSRIACLICRPISTAGPNRCFAAGHVQECFVQRERLHQRRESLEDFADLAGDLGVVVDPRRQEDALRAEPVGGDGGHGAVDAVPPGHVVGRRHHAPLFRRAAHDDRLADQLRPVPLLDRGVKGVHVAWRIIGPRLNSCTSRR